MGEGGAVSWVGWGTEHSHEHAVVWNSFLHTFSELFDFFLKKNSEAWSSLQLLLRMSRKTLRNVA